MRNYPTSNFSFQVLFSFLPFPRSIRKRANWWYSYSYERNDFSLSSHQQKGKEITPSNARTKQLAARVDVARMKLNLSAEKLRRQEVSICASTFIHSYAWNRRIFPAEEVTSFPGDHAAPGTTIFSSVGGVKATRREEMKSGMTKRFVVVLTVVWLAKWITTTTTTTMMMIRTVRSIC